MICSGIWAKRRSKPHCCILYTWYFWHHFSWHFWYFCPRMKGREGLGVLQYLVFYFLIFSSHIVVFISTFYLGLLLYIFCLCNFLNIWSTAIINVLVCFFLTVTSVLVLGWFLLNISLLQVIFFCFSACLAVLIRCQAVWILSFMDFVYFCIPMDLFEFCSGIKLR